jgi:hypothetical protein
LLSFITIVFDLIYDIYEGLLPPKLQQLFLLSLSPQISDQVEVESEQHFLSINQRLEEAEGNKYNSR